MPPKLNYPPKTHPGRARVSLVPRWLFMWVSTLFAAFAVVWFPGVIFGFWGFPLASQPATLQPATLQPATLQPATLQPATLHPPTFHYATSTYAACHDTLGYAADWPSDS